MIILNININNIKKSKTIPMLCCVKAATESVSYTKYVTNKSVPLAYFRSSENQSDKNIYVQDLSWRVPENNENLINSESIEYLESLNFSSIYKEILITNKFYTDSQGASVPLFYRHKTKFIEEPMISATRKGTLKSEGSFIYSDGYLYSNEKNIVENDNYIIWNIAGRGSNGKPVNEIYSPVACIPEVNENSINEEGEVIESCFVRTERTNKFDYTIIKAEKGCLDEHTSNGFFIKPLLKNLLKLNIRRSLKQDNSWGVTVKNNTIFSNGKYWLPEYNRQPFNPILGVLKANNQSCSIISPTLIKINQENIFWSKETPIKIYKYDSELEKKEEISISCLDESTGVVRLSETVSGSDIIRADYFFKSNELIYTKLNANAFENQKMINGRYFFYIKKNARRDETALHHLYINEESIILEVSDIEIALKKQDGSFNDNTYITKSLEDFKQEFCYGYGNEFQYMELGEVSYKDDCLLESTELLDVRDYRSLDESKIGDIVKRQWRILQSKYGYGEKGQVVQKANVLVLEVPIDLLQKYGGDYREVEIEELVKRRIPVGTEIVIEYVFPKSELLVTPKYEKVEIEFSWEGAYTYRIECSKNKEDWNELYSLKILTEPETNLVSLSHENLNSGSVYYYRCVIIDGDIEYPPSNIYGVIIL